MQSPDPFVNTLQEWFGTFRRRMVGNFFTYARDKGLTMGQFGALLHIRHKGACGVSDIGNDLGITNSAASQMLERLVQLNLITRSEDPNDRRVKQILLTDKGQQTLQESDRVFQNWLEDLARTLTPAQQDQVRNSLLMLIDKARQLEKTPS
jgi:DNA-binding MarR family transcriptional regulator